MQPRLGLSWMRMQVCFGSGFQIIDSPRCHARPWRLHHSPSCLAELNGINQIRRMSRACACLSLTRSPKTITPTRPTPCNMQQHRATCNKRSRTCAQLPLAHTPFWIVSSPCALRRSRGRASFPEQSSAATFGAHESFDPARKSAGVCARGMCVCACVLVRVC